MSGAPPATPTSSGPLYVGIDVGGTKILVVVLDSGAIVSRHKCKTGDEKTPAAVLATVKRAYAAAVSEQEAVRVVAVGMAVPGPVDARRNVVLRAVNLGWTEETPVVSAELFAHAPPLHLDNDAKLGALGEHTLGAGRGCHSTYTLLVGTGLGGGYVARDRLVRGPGHVCGEVGHTPAQLGPDAQLCGCGKRGCLETLASKTGMLAWMRAQERRSWLDKKLPEWRTTAMPGAKLLAKALARDDKLVRAAVERAADGLGAACATVLTATGVQCVVLGGGVVHELGAPFLERVCEAVERHSFAGTEQRTLVRPSLLGDDCVAVGAAAWAQRRTERPSPDDLD